MYKVDMQAPENALHLVQVLQDTLGPNYKVWVAGGFLRDSFASLSSHDIDLVICPSNEEAASIDNVTYDVGNRILEGCIPEWFFPTDIQVPSVGFAGILKGVCAPLLMEVTLHVHGKPVGTQEVAEDLCINLNQIVMGPDGVVMATQGFLGGFENKILKVINHNNPKREKIRLSRLLSKYPDFKVIT